MKKLNFILFIFFVLNICFNQYSLSQWSQVGQLSGLATFPRISVVDSNVVWIAGGQPGAVVYRTVNGGLNWTSIPTSGLPYFIAGIAAKDSLIAFVADVGSINGAGGNANIFKTTNGGLNWIFVDSTGGTQGVFGDIIFSKIETEFGIAISDPPDAQSNNFYLSKTTNSGSTWIRTNPPLAMADYGLFRSLFTIDVQFYGFMTLDLSTSTSNSYITSNGGSSWYSGDSPIEFGGTGGDMVFHNNKLTGIMISSSILPNIRRTTNGGVNWSTLNTLSDVTGFISAVWISGTNTVFICGNNSISNRCILRSDDAGLTWLPQNTLSAGIREIDYSRYDNLIIAYCISSPGVVQRSRQMVQTVGIQQIGIEVPNNYSISQNYPNPFNPKTVINYELPVSNTVSLKVFDIIGREIATLVNEYQTAGMYQVVFDGNNLTCGVYFYTYRTEDYAETKRMILIK